MDLRSRMMYDDIYEGEGTREGAAHNPYLLFVKRNRAFVKREYPDASPKEIIQILAAHWRELPENEKMKLKKSASRLVPKSKAVRRPRKKAPAKRVAKKRVVKKRVVKKRVVKRKPVTRRGAKNTFPSGAAKKKAIADLRKKFKKELEMLKKRKVVRR